ncbi:MAG: NTP transferase domain-containing protein [Hyphomicrobium sp.]|uniref:nucleotidyltransferase family protein n=1 Tax=Hyphomicrobium sp. TaxID=82 RepID=UPI003D0E1B83
MAERPQLAAVLLAGGASRRFGADNKLLATVDGAPMVARVARAILDGGVSELIAVTGAEHAAYVAALDSFPVTFAPNIAWDEGIGGSIATGVRALPDGALGAFIVPGDLPNLTADVFRSLGSAFAGAQGAKVVVPVIAGGEQRNPVLWPRAWFSELAALSGPAGGKSLLDRVGDARLDVAFADASLFSDIDTRGDYDRLIAGAPG